MKNNVHKFTVDADIAAAAITSNGVRFFFNNGHGDGFFDVIVKEKTDSHYARDSIKTQNKSSCYRGLFEVGKGSSAHLMSCAYAHETKERVACQELCQINLTHMPH